MEKSKPVLDGRAYRFTIEWPELRDSLLKFFKGDYSELGQRTSRETARYYTKTVSQSFTGYSMAQAEDWIANGYQGDTTLIADFAPPIREKRKFIYADEGDEIDLSAAWAGEDNFMGQWTKRDTIPGIAFDFSMTFVCHCPARIVNQYLNWISTAVESLIEAGIDPEVNAFTREAWYWANHNAEARIRVKREGETADFLSWSAMTSPAAYRTCFFMATVIAGDRLGKGVDTGIAGKWDQPNEWSVKFDRDSGRIRTNNPWSPDGFDADDMNRQLRAAIEELKNG